MLSPDKLKKLCRQRSISIEQLAEQLVRTGLDKKQAVTAVKNWQKGLFKPLPRKEDIRRLATALSIEVNDLLVWCSSYRFAPTAPRKARLVTQLIVGRKVQDAMDILKFTR
jgi:transcriptional regulator with XRE-family HTH domain